MVVLPDFHPEADCSEDEDDRTQSHIHVDQPYFNMRDDIEHVLGKLVEAIKAADCVGNNPNQQYEHNKDQSRSGKMPDEL